MPTTDSLIGRQLANFKILQLIGRGGMAEVYYGWDVKLHRPVAIKLIDARYRDDPAYAERFVHEARAAAAWHHPNILQIHYTDDEDGLYYFVMEYIRGLNLEQALDYYSTTGERMPLRDALRIGRAAAQALDFAHDQGVIHRDVKPSNIMIADDGRVVLADFGLALNVMQGSLGDVFGSPQYIAPEQARRSDAAVFQSDIYSLGVVMYEMLAGRVPFDDPSPTALALQHLTLEPPSPRRFNPALTLEVESALLKALAKDPAERFSTASALLDALEAGLEGPVETAPFLVASGQAVSGLSTTPLAEVIAQHLQTQPLMPAIPEGGDFSRDAQSSWESNLDASDRALPRLPTLSRPALWGLGCGGILLIGVFFFALAAAFAFYGSSRQSGDPATGTIPAAAGLFATETPRRTLDAQQPSKAPATPTDLVVITIPDTPSPTEAPPAPTQTPLPTSEPTSPPAPTRKPEENKPKGAHFALFWDDTSFYIKNLSSQDRSVYPLAFERLGKDDQPLNRMEGWVWGNIYSKFRADYCMILEILNYTDHLDPKECKNRILVYRTPTTKENYIFWTKEEDSKEFRVLWDDREVGRCKIDKGKCDVYLPE